MAAISEPIPSRVTLDLLGSAVYILSTEELLLDALARQPDRLVSWKCDAVVLLRNRTIDWMRFRALSRHFPLAAERALQLQKECLIPVPRSILLKLREPGHLRRRLSALRVDYRQVAWANNRDPFTAWFCDICAQAPPPHHQAGTRVARSEVTRHSDYYTYGEKAVDLHSSISNPKPGQTIFQTGRYRPYQSERIQDD